MQLVYKELDKPLIAPTKSTSSKSLVDPVASAMSLGSELPYDVLAYLLDVGSSGLDVNTQDSADVTALHHVFYEYDTNRCVIMTDSTASIRRSRLRTQDC